MAAPRAAAAADGAEVGRVMAAGFSDDPVFRWLFEEPARGPKLEVFFRFMAEEALIPLGATFLVPGSCAAWTPPGAPPWPSDRLARFIAALATVCTPGDLERLGVLSDLMEANHPTEPHWYLNQLATEPERRGGGAGSALLAHSLASVDAAHLPAYLESSNPRNISLYVRHGFEVTGALDLPGGPSLTTMWRRPR